MMRLSEALLLGATQPLCHGVFIRGEAGCILTAAVRACGKNPANTAEVCGFCFELWPWLLEHNACPSFSQVGQVGADHSDWSELSYAEAPQIKSAALCWIIAHWDGNCGVEFIAEKIAGLESYLADMTAFGKVMQAVRERQSQATGGSPHVPAIASSAADPGPEPVARRSRSVLEVALALGEAEQRHLRS